MSCNRSEGNGNQFGRGSFATLDTRKNLEKISQDIATIPDKDRRLHRDRIISVYNRPFRRPGTPCSPAVAPRILN
jgi:hypothetical protein